MVTKGDSTDCLCLDSKLSCSMYIVDGDAAVVLVNILSSTAKGLKTLRAVTIWINTLKNTPVVP